MLELGHLDRRVRELHWEMYLLERMGMKAHKRYIKAQEDFNKIVAQLRKLRGLPPYEPDK